MKPTLLAFLVLSLASLSAEVILPGLFADGMVLQQQAKVPVWGWAKSGSLIKVDFAGQSQNTKADSKGQWAIDLTPLKASSVPRELKVTVDSEIKVISNVLVGEVWLCSGQSNMGFVMQSAVKAPLRTPASQVIVDTIAAEISAASDPLFRQIDIPRRVSAGTAKARFKATWIESSPETNGKFTAAGYYFGRELRRELGVPVALIKCSWGGSKIESWMPESSFQQTDKLKQYYQGESAKVSKQLAKWDEKSLKAAYQKKLGAWKEEMAIARSGAGANLYNRAGLPTSVFKVKKRQQ